MGTRGVYSSTPILILVMRVVKSILRSRLVLAGLKSRWMPRMIMKLQSKLAFMSVKTKLLVESGAF
eukprot:scaffold264272_cov17-Tisochrysis_lutea.AAC.1